MAKRYYRKGEFIWIKTLNKRGKVQSLDIPNLKASVVYYENGKSSTVDLAFTDIDKLRSNGKVVNQEVKEAKAKTPVKARKSNVQLLVPAFSDKIVVKKNRWEDDNEDHSDKDVILFAKVDPNSDAKIPSKRDEDGCYDVYACFLQDDITIASGRVVLIPTGIASAFDKKYRINAKRERSSTGKIGLTVVSGQIDSGYRGEWFIALNNTTDHVIVITKHVSEVRERDGVIYYPYSKAICQYAVEFVPDVIVKEVNYADIESISSERGKTALGQSGK